VSCNKTSRRNNRNSPYQLEEFAVQMNHSAAGLLWRWRTETLITALTAATTGWLAATWNLTAAAITTTAAITAVMAVPATRRHITRRAWCLITRHRLQRVCWETRMHTRSGRIPLILWIRPTDVGERAWLLCRAGTCAEDFEANAPEIRTACGAIEARTTRHRRWSQIVIIDVIRHDTLSAKRHVRPHILTHHAAAPEPLTGTIIPATRRRTTTSGQQQELPPVIIPAWPDQPVTRPATSSQPRRMP
jgi:hypothetical protein